MDEFQPYRFRPIFARQGHDGRARLQAILLENIIKTRLVTWWRRARHDEDARRLEHSNLVDRLDVKLSVANLAQHCLASSDIDECNTHRWRDATGLADGADNLMAITCAADGGPRGSRPRT